jgi:hypothetical protein
MEQIRPCPRNPWLVSCQASAALSRISPRILAVSLVKIIVITIIVILSILLFGRFFV